MLINFARKIYSHDAISIVEYGARVYGKSFCTDFKNELAENNRYKFDEINNLNLPQ
jgi:hypothetical protein